MAKRLDQVAPANVSARDFENPNRSTLIFVHLALSDACNDQ